MTTRPPAGGPGDGRDRGRIMTAGTEAHAPDRPREGGYATWSPRITPGIGRTLTDEQKLAISFRWLAREDFAENLAGHITWQRPGSSSMLINPWGLWWRELTASDICEVDEDGAVIAGKWDVTPAFHIHTELHRARPDARVVVHNHPYYTSLLACLGEMPRVVHQTASMFAGDISVVDEYTGEVDTAELGRDLARRIGAANIVILKSHGVIVIADTVERATYLSASLERVSRTTVDLMKIGAEVGTLNQNLVAGMKTSLLERGADVYWDGLVRQLTHLEPEVLN